MNTNSLQKRIISSILGQPYLVLCRFLGERRAGKLVNNTSEHVIDAIVSGNCAFSPYALTRLGEYGSEILEAHFKTFEDDGYCDNFIVQLRRAQMYCAKRDNERSLMGIGRMIMAV